MVVDRYKHTRAILGPELFDNVQNAKLLIVGCVLISRLSPLDGLLTTRMRCDT